MTNWRASSGPNAAARREELLTRARHYFSTRNMLAVDGPALSPYAVTDPNIDSFAARSVTGQDYFLRPSPEYWMKRLLADGYPDIYSICRVFRGGESGKRHIPEFTMAEWYRLGFELHDIIEDTIGFIAACLGESRLADNVAQYEYVGAFQELAGVNALEDTVDQLARACNSDARLESEIGSDRSTWLDLILSTIIAPQFAGDRLTVLLHFPASQACMARLCIDDQRVADRFEVFFGDLEIANGYVELTDAEEQRLRFDQDLEVRRQAGRPVFPQDHRLLAALDSGLPDCAGVAVGIERLQMVLAKTDDIGDVVTFNPETS